MNVLEAYKRLKELVDQGKSDLPLIALHDNGDMSKVYIQKFIYEVTGKENIKYLKIGTHYIGISI